MALNLKLAGLLIPSALSLAVAVWVNRPLEATPFNYAAIPVSFNGMASEETPVTDLETSILSTNQIFGRRYYGPQGTFFISIVYYPNGDVNFHHPEGCTRSKGSLLQERGPIEFNGGWPSSQGTYFQILDPSGRVTHFAYAYCTPYRAFGDYVDFRKHLALTSLGKGRTACALIRISLDGAMTVPEAQERLRMFWSEFSPYALKGFGRG